MKYLKILFVLIITAFCFTGCSAEKELNSNAFLRIHIRANSNLQVDQNVKYEIKDEVVKFLTPMVANCKTKLDAMNMINSSKIEIENVANNVLKNNNLNYSSNMQLLKEFFPTRSYGNVTLPADVYDAVILNLGEGKGQNWWCVVYPPLCFTGDDKANLNDIKYKSKIVEIINKFFK